MQILDNDPLEIIFPMKLILISDTHTKHKDIKIPDGDILIHAGDISSRGRIYEVVDFIEWFTEQPHTYKIFIAGNHDFYFENKSESDVRALIPSDIIYLNDSGCTIQGLHIWGSPIQPAFHNWAFNRERGVEIKQHWDLIPQNTDILITHGPPYGILDKTIRGAHVGCEELSKIVEVIQPKVHVFGHIHEDYGTIKQGNTRFINASVLNERYQTINEPVVFEL